MLDGSSGGRVRGGTSEASPLKTMTCRSPKPASLGQPHLGGKQQDFLPWLTGKESFWMQRLHELSPWSCSGRNIQAWFTLDGLFSAASSLCWALSWTGVIRYLSAPSIPPTGAEGLQGEPGTPSPKASLLLPTGCLNCSKVSELTERLQVLEAKVGKQLPPCPQPPYLLPAPHSAHSAFPQHPWAGSFPARHSPSSCQFSPSSFGLPTPGSLRTVRQPGLLFL